MSTFEKIEKFFIKKVTIFGHKFSILFLIALSFFAVAAITSILSFIIALFALNFYGSLLNALLFAWNSGFLYYWYLAYQLQVEMSQYKT